MPKIKINGNLNPFTISDQLELGNVRPTANGGFMALYAFEGIVPASDADPSVARQEVYAAIFEPNPSNGKLERIGPDVLVLDKTHSPADDAPRLPALVTLPRGGFAVLRPDFASDSTTVDFFDATGNPTRSETFKKVFISPFRGAEVDLGFGDVQRFFGFYDSSSGDIHAFDTKNENFRPVPNTFIVPKAFDAGHILDIRFSSTTERVEISGTRATRSGVEPTYDVKAFGVFDSGNVGNPRFFTGLASVGNLLIVRSLEGDGDKIILSRPNEKGVGRTIEFPADRVVSRVFEITGVGFAAIVQRLVGDKLVQRINIYDMQGDLIAHPKITVFGDLDGEAPFLVKLGNAADDGDMRLLLADETDNGPPFNAEAPDRFEELVGAESFSLSVKLNNAGTKLDDALHGFGRGDKLQGLGGNDKLEGHGGNDTLVGGSGKDTLIGGTGNDAITGGSGNDDLRGEGGNDTIKGGGGKDRLDGGNGDDRLEGGSGSDRIEGEAGNDVLLGGGGGDRIEGRGDDDTIEGGRGGDTIGGGGGDDHLDGGAGSDEIFGQEGRDILMGGEGADLLVGGKGADQFLYTSLKHSKFNRGVDEIGDFSRRQGDKIDLRQIDANTKAGGRQSFDFVGDAAFAKVAGELRAERIDSDIVVEGDVNGDGRADLVIVVSDLSSMNSGDFLL